MPQPPRTSKPVPLVLDEHDMIALLDGSKTRHSFLLKIPHRTSRARAGHAVGQVLRVKEKLFCDGASWKYDADRQPVLVTPGTPAHGAMAAWTHHFEEMTCLARSMPEFATRFELEVRGVQTYRLLSMTREQALAEGVPAYPDLVGDLPESPYSMLARPGQKEPPPGMEEVGYYWNRFAKRWSLSIWRGNPWMEAVTFKVHHVGASASPA